MDKREKSLDEFKEKNAKRMGRLEDDWEKEINHWNLKSLTLPDFRLLLENHTHLRALIRSIAIGIDTTPVESIQAICQKDWQALKNECNGLQEQLSVLQSENQILKKDLQDCSISVQKLLDKKNTLVKELSNTQTLLAQGPQLPAVLVSLIQDVQLCERLGLASLPSDNTSTLVRVVAVLAQKENLERLWTILKDRCEAENRPVSSTESQLFSAALSWYNHNWHSRPYCLVEPTLGSSYDFENHLRSCHTPTGESIKLTLLAGIADGSGRLLSKPLVATC